MPTEDRSGPTQYVPKKLSVKNKDYTTASLIKGLHLLADTDLASLRDHQKVADIIRTIGLSFDPRSPYGDDNAYMNTTRWGLWQCPEQLAPFLVELSYHGISSWCEIGTFKGWTTTFITAYLRRFVPKLQSVTIDPVDHQKDRTNWGELEIEYYQVDSRELAGQVFDFCFVDGDHSYSSVSSDYANLGQRARLCAFHDIREELCPDVTRFWLELKASPSNGSFREYIHHSDCRAIMGIGLILPN